MCFYDADKKFITQIFNSKNFTSPSNGQWARISMRTYFGNDVMFITDPVIPNHYIPFGYITDDVIRIDGEIRSVKSDLNQAEKRIDNINELIEFIDRDIAFTDYVEKTDYFMQPYGADAGPYAGVWNYYSFDVLLNEQYTISTYSGQNARAWLMLDGTGRVLRTATATSGLVTSTEK